MKLRIISSLVAVLALLTPCAGQQDTSLTDIQRLIKEKTKKKKTTTDWYNVLRVDEVPLFGAANYSSATDYAGRKKISDFTLVHYLAKSVKYPRKARRKKTTGKVFVNFMVEVDGSISDIRIIKDIGHGCGQAVVDAG